jgi:undecaprenyl-diphosphatase
MKFDELLCLDASLSKRMRVAENPGLLRSIAMIFAHSGDSWFWAVGILLVWFLGDEFWKPRALVLGISVFITAILVLVIKFSVKRRRPEGEWGGIYRTTDPHSFPSGHATRALMLATVVVGLGPPWLAVLLVIWAPLVGLARVAMGVHYLSDVIVGTILGIIMGLVNFSIIPGGISYFSTI